MTLIRALERAIMALSFASSPDDVKAKKMLEEHKEYLTVLQQEVLHSAEK